MIGTEVGASESAKQFSGMWRALIEDVGAAERREGGLNYLWAESAFSFYNAVSFDDADVDEATFATRLRHARAFMEKSARTGFFWLFEELLTPEARASAADVASATGLQHAMTCFGMAGEVLPFPRPDHPSLRFERVSTPEHLDAYAGLNAAAYGMDAQDVRSAMRGSSLWREGVYAYVGLDGDVPACCAGCCPVDGRLFVALVATDPTRQRRGFGEAVTRKALFEAASGTGLTRATLQATEAGRPVYERIGLRVTSRVPLYSVRTEG